MPQHKSNVKRMRTSELANTRNRAVRSTIRTLIRKVIEAKEKTVAEPALREAIATIDKGAKKGVIHKNNASNKKSRLQKLVNALKK